MSVALWLQICGRGSRLDKGKTSLLLLDATDNALRLRHPFYPRRWQLAPRGVKPKGSGGMQRYCQPENRRSCGAQMSPSKRICPTCLKPQGEDCPVCGRFTLWKGFRESGSELCPSCEMGRQLQWRKLWRRLPAGSWWQVWKESEVAPDHPEHLPPDAPYVRIHKDSIGGPFRAEVVNRDHTERNTGQAYGKWNARELAYDLYHKRIREEGI